MAKDRVVGSVPVRAQEPGMRAAHLERLRAQGPLVLAVVELYLETYQESVEVGVTAVGMSLDEFNQRAGELRLIRTLREDLREDMAVVFPELKLERKKEGPRG